MTDPLKKCVVRGCRNYHGQGGFHGEFCTPCWTSIISGVVQPGYAWWVALEKAANELVTAKLDIEAYKYVQQEQQTHITLMTKVLRRVQGSTSLEDCHRHAEEWLNRKER